MIVVPGYGPLPARVLIVGEAPGANEARLGRPFVGKSGAEQTAYLHRHGVYNHTREWRFTNVIGEYSEGNPDPTPAQIAYWTPRLLAEINECEPELIVAVGRFAAQWFLGDSATLRTCHGVAKPAGALDPRRRDRGGPNDAPVISCFHPAAGFRNNDLKGTINADYAAVAAAWKRLQNNEPVVVASDEFAGREVYRDVPWEVAHDEFEALGPDDVIALDTEGSAAHPWSIQWCTKPGTAYTLRYARASFSRAMAALQRAANRGCLMLAHHLMHDLSVLRAMGVDLSRPGVRIHDTAYDAYVLRLEPRGLKPLAWRHCGMRMSSYLETLRPAGDDRQLEYLGNVLELDFPKDREPIIEYKSDGSMKSKTPNHIHARIQRILIDYASLPTEEESDETDDANLAKSYTSFLVKRWRTIDDVQRNLAESRLGPFPLPTMDDIDLDRAVNYASRDPDATLRVYYALQPLVKALKCEQTVRDGMDALPVFEEMQATGMPASRKMFVELADKMTRRMDQLRVQIQRDHYDGRPFNPKATRKVLAVMNRRGLVSAKRSKKTGVPSTGKPGIQHLRETDEAIDLIMTWREHQHTRDMFCKPTLATMDPTKEISIVRPRLKIFGTTTRRLASEEPNLLAMPKHSEFGKMVRGCYVCPPGDLFLECDLSQIEVRFLAHESGDELMCRLFTEIDRETGKPRDVHRETAARAFGVSQLDVTSDQRFVAKCITFGIAYGVSGHGLETQMRMKGVKGWDADACNRMIVEWLKLYKGCERYFRAVEAEAYRTGISRDRWGMVRFVPGVWSDDLKMASEAKRHAVNHRIQGGAQGWLQRSIAELRPTIWEWQQMGLSVRWSLTIHDSLLFWISEDVHELVESEVLKVMASPFGMKLRVPVLAESTSATTWGEL